MSSDTEPHIVVVGAEPTGVEIADTLAELARDTLRSDFRNLDTRSAGVSPPASPSHRQSSPKRDVSHLVAHIVTGASAAYAVTPAASLQGKAGI